MFGQHRRRSESELSRSKKLLTREQFSIPPDELLKKTINYATSEFIWGYCNQHDLESVIKDRERGDIREHIREKNHAKYNQFKDSNFPDYNATVTTNFAAGAGPLSEEEIGALFYSLSEANIRSVMAFGDHLRPVESDKQYERYDYLAYFDIPVNQTKSYTHKEDKIDVTCLAIEGGPLRTINKWCSNDNGLRYATEPVKFTLKVKHCFNRESKKDEREFDLTVTFHPLVDNTYIKLDSRNRKEIDLFLEHYAESFVKPVFVHCASGVGRTGFAIATFEILRHFNQIFQQADPMKAAAEILKIVYEFRKTRPGLIWTDEQFEYAIRNAVALAKFINQHHLEFDAAYHQVLQPTTVPDWAEFLPADVKRTRPLPLYTDNEAVALGRVTPGLKKTLQKHERALSEELEQNGCCTNIKKTKHRLDAVQYFINLLDKKPPAENLSKQYESELSKGTLGEEIHWYAIMEGRYIQTVTNLLRIAYDVAVAAKTPQLQQEPADDKEAEAPPTLRMTS